MKFDKITTTSTAIMAPLIAALLVASCVMGAADATEWGACAEGGNGGTCIGEGFQARCECSEHTSGEFCEHKVTTIVSTLRATHAQQPLPLILL